MRFVALTAALACAACAAPMELDRGTVLHEVSRRYDRFFPDGGGLLWPRFGDPAIIRRGGELSLDLLRHDGQPAPRAVLVAPDLPEAAVARCLAGRRVTGCHRLALTPRGQERIDRRTQELRYTARAAATAGAWDLVVDDASARARKAVWLRDDDPAAPRPLHVVQLSDLHVGKRPAELEPHLAQVIREVNARAPDLVVVTGDLVERGEDPAQPRRAAEILSTLDAPVLTVMGGHDVGMSASARVHRRYGAGWENHARVFHPYLLTHLTLGGWELIGFDTGPNAGPGSLDRGISRRTVAALRGALAAAFAAHRRGVVLFSHAPTRSTLLDHDPGGLDRGLFARMRNGGAELEDVLAEAGRRGQRVLHLSGHTHWSDVYEWQPSPWGPRFARWPALGDEPRALASPVALVGTQAASQSGLPIKHNAQGFGFAELFLDHGADAAKVAHHRLSAGGSVAACRCAP